MECENKTTYPPQSFLDLVDDCLLICEDKYHDETWDKLVKDWAVKLRDEALKTELCIPESGKRLKFLDLLKKQSKKGRKMSRKQWPRTIKKQYSGVGRRKRRHA